MAKFKGEESATTWRRVLTLTNVILIIIIVFLSFRVQSLSNDINKGVSETRLNRIVGCENQAVSYGVTTRNVPLSVECKKLLKVDSR